MLSQQRFTKRVAMSIGRATFFESAIDGFVMEDPRSLGSHFGRGDKEGVSKGYWDTNRHAIDYLSKLGHNWVMPQAMDVKLMRKALVLLDMKLGTAAHLVVGGGAAMLLAYDHPLATQDVDAFAARGGLSVHELEPFARATAKELDIASDWLNAHFETFTFVLPPDYADRLRLVYQGEHLRVDALSPEDLLVMKCFAGRDKDLPHARVLIRLADPKIIDARLDELIRKRVLGAERAADYFDDLQDELG